ncbi:MULTISPECIES: acylphosphatase [Arthrospira]|uniref:acylphosphatase n=1 Tax=Limnospira platensis NIES-46 TaxID=1236695 RepID=A0A5M3TE20_LIMPL|nr:acylphosphatase [Arthrospira platensis]AMW27529.1 acylphosphatase [Arthrospira platensis YZ]KDR55899.1 acylphosphatase [Arthrospira platensis str. Paraca]MBD2574293.1 acylphosphatase [Arthrospira platensis FACHB-971]MBD2670438.1 acylphosphatase [Arthrospira platensis FACHB-439]MBD2712612.1 acylphosphatase [Arthrospira platensis FACHB-835]MDF2210059.1 acylphosphatase [Arthrospira platensis NCB002]MDT9182255.1 acylphosphatase [Limnospira sp. PMC 289.06]MDT9295742.1 acylphosphatase [Arthros
MSNTTHEKPDLLRAHLLISGRVQGVGYRYYTRQVATQKGVNGWVKNLPDGRVEAVFEGSQAQVQTMIEWCHQGPPSAQPTQVKVEYQRAEGLYSFDILYH